MSASPIGRATRWLLPVTVLSTAMLLGACSYYDTPATTTTQRTTTQQTTTPDYVTPQTSVTTTRTQTSPSVSP
jgi:hypothetical protein